MVANRMYSPKAQRLIDLKFAKAELDGLNNFQRSAQREQELLQLEKATGLAKGELIERLHQAGFNARNIEALQWLPVALVAWASDGVSPAALRHNQAGKKLGELVLTSNYLCDPLIAWHGNSLDEIVDRVGSRHNQFCESAGGRLTKGKFLIRMECHNAHTEPQEESASALSSVGYQS